MDHRAGSDVIDTSHCKTTIGFFGPTDLLSRNQLHLACVVDKSDGSILVPWRETASRTWFSFEETRCNRPWQLSRYRCTHTLSDTLLSSSPTGECNLGRHQTFESIRCPQHSREQRQTGLGAKIRPCDYSEGDCGKSCSRTKSWALCEVHPCKCYRSVKAQTACSECWGDMCICTLPTCQWESGSSGKCRKCKCRLGCDMDFGAMIKTSHLYSTIGTGWCRSEFVYVRRCRTRTIHNLLRWRSGTLERLPWPCPRFRVGKVTRNRNDIE